MSMRSFLCAVLATTLAGVHARANIGETQAEIEGRLGKPVSTGGGATAYEKSGFWIEIIYDKGASVAETTRMLPLGNGIPNEMRASLFTVYGKGQDWEQTGGKVWLRSDGKVLCLIDEVSKAITFFDAEYFRSLKREEQSAAVKRFGEVFGPLPPGGSPSPAPR